MAQPYFFDGAAALLSPQRQDFIDQYKFYIEPATDDRPHFFRFFKWTVAAEIFALREQGGMSLFDWSYPLLVATLVQAIAASALLIVAPLALSRCRRTLPSAPVALYFLAIGFAFMFIEIAFIQKLRTKHTVARARSAATSPRSSTTARYAAPSGYSPPPPRAPTPAPSRRAQLLTR